MTDESRRDVSWRPLALGSFLALVAVVVAWNAAAYAIDASDLEAGPDGWGVLFGSAVGTVIYGSVPLLLCLLAAALAAFGTPRMARAAAWTIAVLCAFCAAGLAFVGTVTVGGTSAEVAFGAVSFALALMLLVPLVLCVRLARRERSAAVRTPSLTS